MAELPSIKLSELTGKIQQALQNVFAGQAYWVIADITSHSYYQAKGHHYFDMVEKDATTNAVIAKVQAAAWNTGAVRIKEFERLTGQPFKNDINVLVKISVDYHPLYGLRATLLDIDTSFTIGLLEQQRQATLQRLLTAFPESIQKTGEGYSTKNNRLAHRAVIQKIAVITSNSSAGYQDFKHTLDSNSFGYGFFIDSYFTAVQGEANAEAMYNRLLEVFNSGIPYDTVVIMRGGGAQTDFLIFDQFILGKIVARFPIPIITGIGHQKNETIVDLMAHTPTKTPTRAAEFIIAHNKAFEDAMLSSQQTIIIRTQQSLSRNIQALTQFNQVVINKTKTVLYNKKSELQEVAGRLLSKPRIIVSNKGNDLKNLAANFHSFSKKYFVNQKGYISHHESLCRLMSPVNILKKGFAIVYQNGKIVPNGAGILPGTEIKVRLSEHEILSTVQSKKQVDGDAFNI